MPELVEQMYCSQQIVIPPKFPYLLKRYCKAAIKTQPYDLLRWSFEYFKALAEHRPPPVKLRLEYPVYSTEGGLTRGCLKVLANQLAGQAVLPVEVVKAAWQGFCLDPEELKRILCLCEVYMRADSVPFLAFIAVAGGLLTKSLTHTMILLCETLTKEPDGGSAAICVNDWTYMYKFLAKIDASSNVRYINGFREGWEPPHEEAEPEEEESVKQDVEEEASEDDYWHSSSADLQTLMLIDDKVSKTARLSVKLQAPLLGKIERSPSAERAGEIERELYMRDYKAKPREDEEVDKALRQLSARLVHSEMDTAVQEEVAKEEVKEDRAEKPDIEVYDEEDNRLPLEFFGEPKNVEEVAEEEGDAKDSKGEPDAEKMEEEAAVEEELTEKQKIEQFVNTCYQERVERRIDLELTFDEIAQLVDRFKSANYDLGMVAGRQMSITSGEFIVQHIEREIMEFIDEQIAILPDPDLKKKKAKPEEQEMIKELLWNWLDENMEIIVPEIEEVEEEEEVVPDVVMVYAVPGIGPPVEDDIVRDVIDYSYDVSKVQAEVFMPRNIRHFMCPPLEKYIEYSYDEDSSKRRKEQCPTVGALTD